MISSTANAYVLGSIAGDAFFIASKVVWYVSQPSNVIILLFCIGFLLIWWSAQRRGLQVIAAAALLYAAGALTPLGNAITIPLEDAYPRGTLAEGVAPDGIIVLGGAVDTVTATTRNEVTLTEAAERLTEAVALARRYPRMKIVFSGGDGALVYSSITESETARRFFTEMGVDMSRVTFEDRSRTTYENAAYTKEILAPKPGERWLLVTSAFHMLRAQRCFLRVGFETTPWPVDYRTRGPEDLLRFPPRASEGWRRIDLAVKEWIGLLAYRVSGRC